MILFVSFANDTDELLSLGRSQLKIYVIERLTNRVKYYVVIVKLDVFVGSFKFFKLFIFGNMGH